jgi:uncharacterized protein (DUF433 family)
MRAIGRTMVEQRHGLVWEKKWLRSGGLWAVCFGITTPSIMKSRIALTGGPIMTVHDDIIKAQPVPLTMDQEGVLRVGGTRVTLDTVVEAFQEGLTAEEIVQQYPSLSLPDVYAVLSYYLSHQDEVERYMEERKRMRDKIKRQNERLFDPTGIRNRLLARKRSKRER